MQQAQQRSIDVEQMYSNAQILLKQASDEAIEIRIQTEKLIKQQNEKYQDQIATNIQKLRENAITTINNQKQKIQKQVSQKIIDSTMQKIFQKFEKNLNEKIQKSINISSIQLLQSFK